MHIIPAIDGGKNAFVAVYGNRFGIIASGRLEKEEVLGLEVLDGRAHHLRAHRGRLAAKGRPLRSFELPPITGPRRTVVMDNGRIGPGHEPLGIAWLRPHATACPRRPRRPAQGRSGQHGLVAHHRSGAFRPTPWLVVWLKSPGIDMGKVQFATSPEAAAMATSLMLDEFTAQNLWMVQASVVLAVVVAAGLYPTTQVSFYSSSLANEGES